MGSDVIDFLDYLNMRSGNSKPTVTAEDLKEFTRLDDRSISWLSTLFALARYTLFLKALFYRNNKGHGNRNTGFLVGFTPEHLEKMQEIACSVIANLGRPPKVVDADKKSYLDIVFQVTGCQCMTNAEAYESLESYLYEGGDVIVIKNFSLSKTTHKDGLLRDWVKALDDAHVRGIVPKSELLLIDFASFLQKVWHSIGPYLSILAYSEEEGNIG